MHCWTLAACISVFAWVALFFSLFFPSTVSPFISPPACVNISPLCSVLLCYIKNARLKKPTSSPPPTPTLDFRKVSLHWLRGEPVPTKTEKKWVEKSEGVGWENNEQWAESSRMGSDILLHTPEAQSTYIFTASQKTMSSFLPTQYVGSGVMWPGGWPGLFLGCTNSSLLVLNPISC